jgi:S1-C subfamily serine protease
VLLSHPISSTNWFPPERPMTFRSNLERIAEIYGGIAIFSVDQGSTTHRAGIRAGDVLVQVNGRRVRRMADYASARSLRPDVLELVVVRGGKTLTLWAGVQARKPVAANDNGRDDAGSVTCPWRGAA